MMNLKFLDAGSDNGVGLALITVAVVAGCLFGLLALV